MSNNPRVSTTVVLGGEPYVLRWDKGAMFDADEVGLWSGKPSAGPAHWAKYLWAMLPPAGRLKFPTPRDVFRAMPPIAEVVPIINAALEQADESVDPKKVYGSTSGPSPASSSTSPTTNTGDSPRQSLPPSAGPGI